MSRGRPSQVRAWLVQPGTRVAIGSRSLVRAAPESRSPRSRPPRSSACVRTCSLGRLRSTRRDGNSRARACGWSSSPRLVEILSRLAASGGSVVTKEALLDRFWPDVHVSENTVARAVADIRKAIDDDAGAPVYIQTVAGRGYRFIGKRITADVPGHPLLAPEWHVRDVEEEADPFLLWVRGKLSLESLDQRRLPKRE